MVIDTSALIAILCAESDAPAYSKAIALAPRNFMAAPSYVECAMVMIARFGEGGLAALDELIAVARIEILPFNANCARAAAGAFFTYGRGRHPARLNFGDCMAYAMARTEVLPLLFKGDDFRQTDIEAVL